MVRQMDVLALSKTSPLIGELRRCHVDVVASAACPDTDHLGLAVDSGSRALVVVVLESCNHRDWHEGCPFAGAAFGRHLLEPRPRRLGRRHSHRPLDREHSDMPDEG